MTDIGVYTTVETLDEKKEFATDPDFYVWWTLSKEPKSIPEKVFFAANKKWQGFFTIEQIRIFTEKEGMKIFLDEWHEIDKKTERSPFRGFTYRTPEVV